MRKLLVLLLLAFTSCEIGNKTRLEDGYEFFEKGMYANAKLELSQIRESSGHYEEAKLLIEKSQIKLDSIEKAKAEIDSKWIQPEIRSQSLSSKYSEEVVSAAKSRVERWVSLNYVKIQSDDKIYISPLLWDSVDIDGKKEVAYTLLVYTEVFQNKGAYSSVDFFDKQTGKEIASWSDFSGFEIN